MAFSCKCRYFCPSCHARRLLLWSEWLREELLVEVPHRQYVFTIPKRLRPYFLHDRRLLGRLSRIAYRTLHEFLCGTLGAPDLVPGAISSIQTFGRLANWHPHIHLIVTDGTFRPDGTFLTLSFHSVEVLTEAFRRAVLADFVREELFTPEIADSMLSWPHSGFHVHNAVRIEAGETRGTLHLARYAARAPVALSRMSYVPRKGEILVRYYGAYSVRRRAAWRREGIRARLPGDRPGEGEETPESVPERVRARRKRWGDLLRRIWNADALRWARWIDPRSGWEPASRSRAPPLPRTE